MSAETLDCGCVDDRQDLANVYPCCCDKCLRERERPDSVDLYKRVVDQLEGWTEAEKREAYGK